MMRAQIIPEQPHGSRAAFNLLRNIIRGDVPVDDVMLWIRNSRDPYEECETPLRLDGSTDGWCSTRSFSRVVLNFIRDQVEPFLTYVPPKIMKQACSYESEFPTLNSKAAIVQKKIKPTVVRNEKSNYNCSTSAPSGVNFKNPASLSKSKQAPAAAYGMRSSSYSNKTLSAKNFVHSTRMSNPSLSSSSQCNIIEQSGITILENEPDDVTLVERAHIVATLYAFLLMNNITPNVAAEFHLL
eukprot:66150_1